ncbi:MAG TPA: hypothetical protein DD422_09950 [Akkermansia sp.]|nr:hypothetical protein [Akkermansia sp.]
MRECQPISPQHVRRDQSCRPLLITADYSPAFFKHFLIPNKKIKIIKFNIMTEHKAAFFFQPSGKSQPRKAARHSRNASGTRKKTL